MKLPTSRAALLALKDKVDEAWWSSWWSGTTPGTILKASEPKVGDTVAEFLLETQTDEDLGVWVSRDQIDSILASQPKTRAAKAPRRAGRKGA